MSQQDEFPKKLKAYIIAHLRRIGYRNIHRAKAFAKVRLGYAQHQCPLCQKIFTSTRDLHGDHLVPVVSPDTGFTTWDDYINRLFLGEIQAICTTCHKQKSESENVVRRKKRKSKTSSD